MLSIGSIYSDVRECKRCKESTQSGDGCLAIGVDEIRWVWTEQYIGIGYSWIFNGIMACTKHLFMCRLISQSFMKSSQSAVLLRLASKLKCMTLPGLHAYTVSDTSSVFVVYMEGKEVCTANVEFFSRHDASQHLSIFQCPRVYS